MKLTNIYIFLLALSIVGCKNKDNIITYKPIGYFSSKFTIETGAPRQGMLRPESKGVIILDTVYTRGLSQLDKFEYIWVISHFHKARGWENIVTPPAK